VESLKGISADEEPWRSKVTRTSSIGVELPERTTTPAIEPVAPEGRCDSTSAIAIDIIHSRIA
jgi:hypothetical protein